MMRRPTIGYFLALLAVAGLLLAPSVHSTMAMAGADRATIMDAVTAMADMGMSGGSEDMPCCPGKASIPDCGGDCPFMACSPTPFNVPVASLTVPPADAGVVVSGDQSDLVSVTCAPPRRPPKI
jgi:hypothetical protein